MREIKLTRKMTLILMGLEALNAASHPLGPPQVCSLHGNWWSVRIRKKRRKAWEWYWGEVFLHSLWILSSWSLEDLGQDGWIMLKNAHRLSESQKEGLTGRMCFGVHPSLVVIKPLWERDLTKEKKCKQSSQQRQPSKSNTHSCKIINKCEKLKQVTTLFDPSIPTLK